MAERVSAIEEATKIHPSLNVLLNPWLLASCLSIHVYTCPVASHVPLGVNLGVAFLGVGKMGKLTALAVKSLKHPSNQGRPVRFPDGDGLYLQVTAGDAKSWLFRYMLNGKSREMGLGPAGDPPDRVPLAKARTLAAQAKGRLQGGHDPIDERQAEAAAKIRAQAEAKERTFKAAAQALVDSKQSGWRNAKHGAQWLATLKSYAYPEIGDKPVAEIDTAAVLAVLRPIWERVPETASRVRQRIEAVLDAAAVKGWRSGDNPARWKGHLAGALPPPRKVKPVEHHPALPWQRIGAFMASLNTREGMAPLALRFVILTAARTGEVRKMRWNEVDFEAKVWTVPSRNMKAGKTHRVPLSPMASAVLDLVMPLRTKDTDLVFPGARKLVPLSDMALSEVVRRMNEGGETGARPPWSDAEGRAVVPHGFRACFRMWAGETRPEGREVVEMALAHTIKDKVEAAYARSDLLEKRRVLMEAWAEQCARLPAAG